MGRSADEKERKEKKREEDRIERNAPCAVITIVTDAEYDSHPWIFTKFIIFPSFCPRYIFTRIPLGSFFCQSPLFHPLFLLFFSYSFLPSPSLLLVFHLYSSLSVFPRLFTLRNCSWYSPHRQSERGLYNCHQHGQEWPPWLHLQPLPVS